MSRQLYSVVLSYHQSVQCDMTVGFCWGWILDNPPIHRGGAVTWDYFPRCWIMDNGGVVIPGGIVISEKATLFSCESIACWLNQMRYRSYNYSIDR